jgi:hypothetical protein
MRRFLLTAALLALTSPVAAGPPPEGWQGPLTRASILCDTAEQLVSIFDAFEAGPDEAKSRYVELFTLRNARNEPTCAVTAIRHMTAGESSELGLIEIDGSRFRGWAVHVRNRSGSGYYLYLESERHYLDKMI